MQLTADINFTITSYETFLACDSETKTKQKNVSSLSIKLAKLNQKFFTQLSNNRLGKFITYTLYINKLRKYFYANMSKTKLYKI